MSSNFTSAPKAQQDILLLPITSGRARDATTGRYASTGIVAGYTAVVDDEFSRTVLAKMVIHNSSGYATVTMRDKLVRIHNLVYVNYNGEIQKGMLVDHVDKNKLNNTIVNLRLADKQLNAVNAKLNAANTSGYTGVIWHHKVSKWNARVSFDGRIQSLGLYDDKEDAARAVNIAYHARFPTVSLPNGVPEPLRRPKKDRSKGNTSGYSGVSFHKLTGKWAAYVIMPKGGQRRNKMLHLGLFSRKEDAALAVNAAWKIYHPGQLAPNEVTDEEEAKDTGLAQSVPVQW